MLQISFSMVAAFFRAFGGGNGCSRSCRPPVAGLEAQQPELAAFGRHGEHGDDVQLALAGEDNGSADRGGPVKGIPMYPAAVPGPSPFPATSAGCSAPGPRGPGVST